MMKYMITITKILEDKTYQTCGCSMTMHTTTELESFMSHANFKEVVCREKEFELMNLSILFNDYSPAYLFTKFINNIRKPPAPIANNSSWYLLRRTLGIFSFFMRYRSKFGAAEIIGIK